MASFQHCATPAGALRVRIADHFVARALGLLVGAPLDLAEGLMIAPCASIHTIGMRYPIDVVFIDREARVLRVCAEVRAGRMRFAPSARGVLELRAGIAAQQGLVPGVRLPELAAALDPSEASRENASGRYRSAGQRGPQ
jgi:uncharacterized membrane protein (UPF0127 family)